MVVCMMCGNEVSSHDHLYPECHRICNMERLRRIGAGKCVKCGKSSRLLGMYYTCEQCEDDMVSYSGYPGAVLV